MKCTNCGGDVASNTNFCGLCGTPIDHKEDSTEKKAVSPASTFDASKLKKYIIPAILVIALIIVAVIARNAFKPSKYVQYNSTFGFRPTDEEIVIQPPGKEKTTIEGLMMHGEFSLDNSKVAFIVVEDDNYGGGGTLYIADEKGAERIADDVYKMTIASSGEGVAFVQEVDGDVGTLCLYKGGKTTTISADVSAYNRLSISPDGSVVGYTVYDDLEYETIGYFFDGKQKELGKDIIPVAISNGAKHVYYQKNGKLYVQKGDNTDTKVSLGEYRFITAFNKDLSELIFTADTSNGYRSYISRNGGEKERLPGEITDILLPAGTIRNEHVLGINSFADTYYLTYDDDVYHINGKYESRKVLSNAYEPQLSIDGKTIFYQDYDNIEKINGSKESAEAVELVEEDVYSFVVTGDKDAIYYITYDGELYYQKGKGKPVLVDNDLSSDRFALYMGNKLFYVSDEELYVSTDGKGTAVDGIDGYVERVVSVLNSVYVYANDDYDTLVYQSIDGENFELIDQY